MVVIWGIPNCGFCEKAKAICEQYELKHEYVEVDDIVKLNDLRNILPDFKTFPQIFWHDKHIGGYTELATEIENTRNFGQDTI